MKKIRIGKDIGVRWKIRTPFNEGGLSLSDISIDMKDPRGCIVPVRGLEITGDTIVFGLRGTAFAYLGGYTLTCWRNKGREGQTMVDAVDAFTLVSSTDRETGPGKGCGVLELATVDLYSQLEFFFAGEVVDASILSRITALETAVSQMVTQISGLQSDITDLTARVEALEHEDPPAPPVTYTITRSLSHVTSSNSSNSVNEGSSYTTTLSLVSGYQNMSVTVSMGGTNITSSALNGNVVTIASVTGNVVITATATQIPVQTEYVYAGSVRNSTSDPVSISQFTSGASSTTKAINYTPTEVVNTIIAVCPSTMSLTSCVKHGEIEENITSEMTASVSNVTYENKSCKMYQFKFGVSIKNTAFTITFN